MVRGRQANNEKQQHQKSEESEFVIFPSRVDVFVKSSIVESAYAWNVKTHALFSGMAPNCTAPQQHVSNQSAQCFALSRTFLLFDHYITSDVARDSFFPRQMVIVR